MWRMPPSAALDLRRDLFDFADEQLARRTIEQGKRREENGERKTQGERGGLGRQPEAWAAAEGNVGRGNLERLSGSRRRAVARDVLRFAIQLTNRGVRRDVTDAGELRSACHAAGYQGPNDNASWPSS
jgi:hypothetical protein